uniref:Uncharacterized protein n=1 Tax=Phakopsora pachyrhizi TaxID=170000 RepID=A0A0S1MIN7_PHAPC
MAGLTFLGSFLGGLTANQLVFYAECTGPGVLTDLIETVVDVHPILGVRHNW